MRGKQTRKAVDMPDAEKSQFHNLGEFGSLSAESKYTVFAPTKDDGSDYKEGVQPGGMDIIEQWRNLLPQMPRTASVARNILPIMATSIPSERIFSRVKYVGRNRERLTPARMEQLVLSSMNMAHFEKVMPGIGSEEEDVPEDAFVGESEGIVDEGAGEAGEAGEY